MIIKFGTKTKATTPTNGSLDVDLTIDVTIQFRGGGVFLCPWPVGSLHRERVVSRGGLSSYPRRGYRL